MDSHLDFSRIIATENSWLITSMSTLAGALSEKGLLPSSALTDFRINVSGLQGGRQVHSMVQELDQCQDVLFHYLCHSLGRDQLISSLWLQFTSRIANHLTSALTRAHLGLLEIGKKHFNRNITLSNDDVCSVPELILDLNSLTESAIDSLSCERAFLFLSHDLPDELNRVELSEIFGLPALSTNLASYHAGQLIIAQLQSIENLIKGFLTLQNAISQATTITKDSSHTGLLRGQITYSDTILSSQIKVLAHCLSKVPETKDFTKAMERATELMNLSLAMCEDLISEIFKTLDEKLTTKITGMMPLQLRKVQSHLIKSGYKPHEAREASQSLKNYLTHHEISISELLTSEAVRIHPSLGHLTIDHLKTNTTVTHSEIKDKAEKNFSDTSRKLSDLIARTTQFVLILLLISSCGVKGSLKSVAEPLRPIVPPMGDSHAAPK